MNSNKHGFTLIELLVVVAMIAIIAGVMTTSVAAAQQRARVQKATSEVKSVTQAILAYENYNGDMSDDDSFTLEPLGGGPGGKGAEATKANLSFLLGRKKSTDKLPVLLLASLQQDAMRDPWGTPYRIYIHAGTIQPVSPVSGLQMNYDLPNRYRLTEDERTDAVSDTGGSN